jgi:ribosomal protein S12 methylthiotransferase
MVQSNPKTSKSAPRVAVVSLGCAKNTVDSEVMMGRLAASGFSLVSDPADAEVVVVNTCGFIEAAKKESIDAILQAAKFKKGGKLKTLAVGGCLAQRYGEELRKELPEIDLLFGLNEVERLAERLAEKAPLPQQAHRAGGLEKATYVYDASSPRLLSTPAYTAYVKISEGCDLPCAFCVIPKIRGKYRSRPMEDIEREVQNLAAQGVREVCLVAQDSTWYGADLYGKPKLAELLRRLSKVEPLTWVRLHYLYPTRVNEELLEAMTMPRITPYFDVPLQHASDPILKAMRRMGGRKQLDEALRSIRGRFPKGALRSTFIVGFPGETDDDFAELLDFLRDARLDYAGFFAFSPEEGTFAATMKHQIPKHVKEERLAAAYALQECIAESAHQRWVGDRLQAVVEGIEADGTVWARTQYQAPEVDGVVQLETESKGKGKTNVSHWKMGQWLEVEVTHVLSTDLVGRPL